MFNLLFYVFIYYDFSFNFYYTFLKFYKNYINFSLTFLYNKNKIFLISIFKRKYIYFKNVELP